MSDLFQDTRFSHVVSDPRFKNVSKSKRQIKIDKRFQSVFTDKKFQLKYDVDIRGRPVRETQADNYKKYYDISSDTDDSSNSEENENLPPNLSGSDSEEECENNEATEVGSKLEDNVCSDLNLKARSACDKSNISNKLINKAIDEIHKSKINEAVHEQLQDMGIDYARGVGTLMSDSSDDDSSSDESDSVFVEHPWGELDRDVDTTDEATRRLGICYLDWDRIYAKDIMVLLHSFLPADGIIESVTVYPSEFGIERMKEEELKGPKELVEIAGAQRSDEEDCNDEDPEGKAYHMEKLREYQLNRLKYYYAVVVCNNAETANKLYLECNGMEYESCAAKLDMRFIPDEMTFDQEPREVCSTLPDVTKYKPRLFENSALRQGKVSLTWDETDPRRIEFNKKIAAGDNVVDEDLHNYIACSSEESENDEINKNDDSDSCGEGDPQDKISKYRSLIAELQNKEEQKKNKDVEMEISWGGRLMTDDNSYKGSEIDNPYKDSEVDDVNSPNESDDPSSTEVQNSNPKLNKKKIKKKKKIVDKMPNEEPSSDEEKKNAELDLLLTEDVLEENKKHFNLKGIQKQEKEGKAKKKKWRKELKKKISTNKEEDNFRVDVTDSRFSALYTSHLFNIDPAHPQFKKTKGMEEFVGEKQKRRKLCDAEVISSSTGINPKKKLKPEVMALVSSIKEKTLKT